MIGLLDYARINARSPSYFLKVKLLHSPMTYWAQLIMMLQCLMES